MQSKGLTRVAVLMTALLAQAACSTLTAVKNEIVGGSPATGEGQRLTGFIGAVAADEPRAALAGREVLALGGSAGDAAVAMGFTLAVTLPSRAGIGAGGACLAYNPKTDGPGRGSPEAILFTPVAPGGVAAGVGGGADRPAAVPMLPRGLFALHARYGRQPFEQLLGGAEQLAQFGTPASRALVRDLAVVAGPLSRDPNAARVFLPGGQPLQEGGLLLQPDLGATLSQIRTAGVGDLYQGALARRLVDASRLAGGPIGSEALRGALPVTGGALVVPAGRDMIAFLPPPADGGLAAAAAFRALEANPGDLAGAQARAAGTLLRWRAGGGDAQAMLASGASDGGSLPAMPASTSYAVLDRDGNAVTCVLTMDNLFGTGRIVPGMGLLLAASPGTHGLPMLPAAIVWNANLRAFRAAVGGSGQEGAAVAVAAGVSNALRSGSAMPAAVPEPGRANAIACARYLPDNEASCSWATDPRGFGLATAGN